MSSSRTPSSPLSVRLRPGERVRRYILEQEELGELEEGRLPTMRDLAAHLSVSLATVQTIYRELKEEGRIITRTGDGTYLASHTPKRAGGRKRRIFINRLPNMREEPSSLQGGYYGALLQALSNSETKFDLSFLDTDRAPEEQVKELFLSGELEGIIIFPFVPCQPLIEICDELAVPYVTVHPANPSTTANFVTPDFFQAGVRLGEAIRTAGRKRAAILAFGEILLSSTAWAVVSGFCTGAMVSGYQMTLEMITHRDLLASGKDLKTWLQERRHCLPDVILCHWTQSRWMIADLLAEMKVAVPEEVSLVSVLHAADDGSSASTLTRFSVECDKVCKEAVALLEKRIGMKGEPLPGVKIPLHFKGGKTTTTLENQQLGLL